MKRIPFIVLALMLAVSLFSFVFAQDAKQVCVVKTVAGKVVELDWVAATIVVKWLGSTGYDELTISVPDDAPITKGSEEITLADVELSDDVYIEYRDCELVGLKAIRITVNSNG